MGKTAYIGFGSNLGDRAASFEAALEALDDLPGTVVTKRSGLYETEPEGLSDGGASFLNAVIELETELSIQSLMSKIRAIERRLGKSSDHRSDLSRPIDLDLLLYGDEVLKEEDLEVPHPRMASRAFVIVPLAEVAPHAFLPPKGPDAAELLSMLPREARALVRAFQLPSDVPGSF
jgi:2-amino-4-hydroxy-6-hydroxymethyldihydropteridine diphosphokinase